MWTVSSFASLIPSFIAFSYFPKSELRFQYPNHYSKDEDCEMCETQFAQVETNPVTKLRRMKPTPKSSRYRRSQCTKNENPSFSQRSLPTVEGSGRAVE